MQGQSTNATASEPATVAQIAAQSAASLISLFDDDDDDINAAAMRRRLKKKQQSSSETAIAYVFSIVYSREITCSRL